MAYKVLLTKRNSAYKVVQNPIKGNSYTDIVGFKDLTERDQWLTDFLGYDWKTEINSKDEFNKRITINNEINMSVNLDLTRDTQFGLNKREALQCDLMILEDTNEAPDSMYRYTFWSVQCSQPNGVYTTLNFSGEMDIFLTLPIRQIFKEGAKIRLERAHTNDILGYGSELSYDEQFGFETGNFVLDEIYSTEDGDANGTQNAVMLSFLGTQANNSSGPMPIYYMDEYGTDGKPTGTSTELGIGFETLEDTDPDNGKHILSSTSTPIFYIICDPKNMGNSNQLPNGWKGTDCGQLAMKSEYLVSAQVLPFSYSEFLAQCKSNNWKGVFTDPQWYGIAHDKTTPAFPHAISSGACNGVVVDAVDGIYNIGDLTLNYHKKGIRGTITMEEILKRENDNNLYNKMYHSNFSKTVITYGNLDYEVKPELWTDLKTNKTDSLLVQNFFSPQSLNLKLKLANIDYYRDSTWGYRYIDFAGDFKLPTVVSGDQGTLQNFNSLNVSNNINRRDAEFQYNEGKNLVKQSAWDKAKAVLSGLGMVSGFVGKGGWGLGASLGGLSAPAGSGSAFQQASNEKLQGRQMMASAHDNINKQSASLADANNNVGGFNDGTKSGIEAYSQYVNNNGFSIFTYKLQEPIRSMCVEFLKMYGYAMGGNLYDIQSKLKSHKKYDFIQASEDYGVIYQALAEFISPNMANIIALSIMDGTRIWWADDFTFVGDYSAVNNCLDSNGNEIPDSDVK